MTDLYRPTQAVYNIHVQHRESLSKHRLSLEDMDRWQLDLLYHYLPEQDEETAARARETIHMLERRISAGKYPRPEVVRMMWVAA